MKEHGTVQKCKNNFITVRIGRNSACASCGKCGMTENQKHVDFLVENTLDAKVGDVVEVEIPEANSAPLAFFAYILPLIPALALMFVAFALKWKEYLALLMFVGGLAVGFGIVVLIDRLRKHKWMQAPTLVSVVVSAQAVAESSAANQQNTPSEVSEENSTVKEEQL